jgi:hypothetical protein
VRLVERCQRLFLRKTPLSASPIPPRLPTVCYLFCSQSLPRVFGTFLLPQLFFSKIFLDQRVT